jgi:hypothetical protein
MSKLEIISMLEHYYELDLDNCLMSHKHWVEIVASALTNKDYLKELQAEYKIYLEQINA